MAREGYPEKVSMGTPFETVADSGSNSLLTTTFPVVLGGFRHHPIAGSDFGFG